MSLFWLKEQSAAAPKRRNDAVRLTLPLDLSKLSCRQCTLDKAPLQHPKMLPTGAAKPVFYILGEAPGKTEDEKGEQFVGKSGDLLRDRLPSKWTRHIRWNNTVRCRPTNEKGNRDPSALEMACCRHLQENDIAATKPAVILAFGAIALQWLTRAETMPAITHWRGRRLPVRVGGHSCWAYPMVHPAAIGRWQNDKKLGPSWLRCFENDLARAFEDYEAGLPEPYVEDPSDYKKGIEILTQFGPTGLKRIEERLAEIAKRPDSAIDLETNGLRPFFIQEPKLLTVAVGNYDDTFAFGIDHPEVQWTVPERLRIFEMLYEFLLRSGRKWAHFLKFEQEWLRFFFDDHILYKTEWEDTQAQAHAIDERPAKALEDLTLLHLGFDVKKLSNLDRSRLSQYPLPDVLYYNSYDVKYCDAVRVIQTDIIANLGVERAYENLVRLTPSLVRMQAAGMVRDLPAITLLHNQLEIKANEIVRKILTNPDVGRFKQRHGKFNPSSNQDLLAFFKWLEFKVNNVDEEALIGVDHPVAEMVVALRTEKKMDSTYVKPLMDGGKAVALDGRYHPEFGHTVTVTSRLASESHNFPRRERKEIRRVIGAPPRHKFVAADYGQIEARVVGMLSKDKTLVAETRNGDDIHGVWTDKIGGRFIPKKLKEKDGRKWVRDGIKNLWTFPNFFGNVVEAMAWDLSNRFEVDISKSQLQPFYDEFWAKYEGVLEWQRGLDNFYWENGYVQTATGFRRHEPMKRNEWINQPVQGTASQIVLDAQVRIDRLAYEQDKPWRSPMFNGHDDLSFYLPDRTLEEDIEFIAREMCCCKFEFINVPLAAEFSVGDNWADKEPLHTFTTRDFT